MMGEGKGARERVRASPEYFMVRQGGYGQKKRRSQRAYRRKKYRDTDHSDNREYAYRQREETCVKKTSAERENNNN